MSPGPSGKKSKNPQKKSFMEQYREYLQKQQNARNAPEKDDESRRAARDEKIKEPAQQGMPEEDAEAVDETPRKKTGEEKRREHILRIEKTLVACVIGIVTGVISYLIVSPSQVLGLQSYTILALLIMVAGIVVQRHVFILLKLGSDKMGAKDWFYQGFMTFAFWFITWTLLLTPGA